MTEGPTRFSERDANRVLQRASELQEASGSPSSAMSLVELERVGEEAGIDPKFVRRAAGELSIPAQELAKPVGWAGGPRTIALETTFEGKPDPEVYATLVAIARRTIGTQGTHDVLGSTLSWSSVPAGPRLVMVTVTPGNAATTIRVEENMTPSIGSLFGGLFGGLGGGLLGLVIPVAARLGPMGVLVGCVTWILAMFAITRGIYRRRVEARRAELAGMLEQLTQAALPG